MSSKVQLISQVTTLRKVLDRAKITLSDRRAECKESLRVLREDCGVGSLEEVNPELDRVAKLQNKEVRAIESGLRKAGETYEW